MKYCWEEKFAGIYSHLVWAGGFFFVIYWFLESAVHSYIFDGGSFMRHVIAPDTHEIWMRLIVGSLLIIFSLYGQNVINRQQKMQRELQQAHAELSQIFQTASVGMRLIDKNFNILKVNQTFAELSGIGCNAAIGKKCYEVFGGNMCHTDDCPLCKVLEGKHVADQEVSKVRADGSTLFCSLTATPFEQSNAVVGVVESFKDITEIKKIQNVIQNERDRLHRILFHQFESVGIITDNYTLEYQNELLKKQTRGKAPFYCYQVFREKNEPCDGCLMQKAFTLEKIQRFEFETTSGKYLQHTYTPFVDINGEKKAVISQRDITEARASEAAAINSERLIALGELAAGVAHEINNPINGIINYAQIIANKTKKEDQLHEISSRIIGEGDRIAIIVANLLSFARRESDNRCPVNIKDLLNESLALTRVQLKKDGITLSVKAADNLPPVSAMPQEIEQVFLNIISNSRYALNEKYPNKDTMKKMDIKINSVKNNGDISVQTSFTDYGTGLPPELIKKAVNPFFSTKPKGKGTGLGLAISTKIMENHGGSLTIRSTPNRQTQVIVALPALREMTFAKHLSVERLFSG